MLSGRSGLQLTLKYPLNSLASRPSILRGRQHAGEFSCIDLLKVIHVRYITFQVVLFGTTRLGPTGTLRIVRVGAALWCYWIPFTSVSFPSSPDPALSSMHASTCCLLLPFSVASNTGVQFMWSCMSSNGCTRQKKAVTFFI